MTKYTSRGEELVAYLPQSDFALRVRLSQIPGLSVIAKYGRNPDIDTISGFEAIWNGGADYTGHDPTGAEDVEVFSSAAGDTSISILVEGLDANYDYQSETIVTDASDGTTAVDSVNSYLRLNRAQVTSGTGASGNITIRQNVTTANVFAVMPAGYNQTMIAAYTIPANKTGWLYYWFAATSSNVAGINEVRLMARPENEVFKVKEELSVGTTGSSYVPRLYPLLKGPFNEKTDIKIMANSDANNMGVAAGFDLLLVDD